MQRIINEPAARACATEVQVSQLELLVHAGTDFCSISKLVLPQTSSIMKVVLFSCCLFINFQKCHVL